MSILLMVIYIFGEHIDLSAVAYYGPSCCQSICAHLYAAPYTSDNPLPPTWYFSYYTRITVK